MSTNGKAPLQFPGSAGIPVIGQPVTLSNLAVCVNCTVTCNCTIPGQEMQVLGSLPVTCPACAKGYIPFINPATGQVCVGAVESKEKEPS